MCVCVSVGVCVCMQYSVCIKKFAVPANRNRFLQHKEYNRYAPNVSIEM